MLELEVPEVCASIEAAQILREKVHEDRPGSCMVADTVALTRLAHLHAPLRVIG